MLVTSKVMSKGEESLKKTCHCIFIHHKNNIQILVCFYCVAAGHQHVKGKRDRGRQELPERFSGGLVGMEPVNRHHPKATS